MKEIYVLFVMLYHPQFDTLSHVKMWSDIYGSAIMFENKNNCKDLIRTFSKTVVIPPGNVSFNAKYSCVKFPKNATKTS